MPFTSSSRYTSTNKKKPPPRPPPPNLAKYKSKSTVNIDQQVNLIDWSPPQSPKVERSRNFGGSVSSSFSSSTSSLASSKRSFECDSISNGPLPPKGPPQGNSTFYTQNAVGKVQVASVFGPTIIRAQQGRGRVQREPYAPPSPPMPSVPPPSPPKEVSNVNVAYGIALFDYQGAEPCDLQFQANDVIILLKRINKDWYYGKLLEKEGMFPANFIEVQVPLIEPERDESTVIALYEFSPQVPGDLALKPGQSIRVTRKIDNDWLYGESNGLTGQFPSNFVDRIPNL